MSLLSIRPYKSVVSSTYLSEQLISQLLNGGIEPSVIQRSFNILNHIEPIEEYFPVESLNRPIALSLHDTNYSVLINSNPFLDIELRKVVNWNELIFSNVNTIKNNGELNLQQLNLINNIILLINYLNLKQNNNLANAPYQLTKEWELIYKNKNLRFPLLVHPKQANKPHTLTLKLNELLEEIRVNALMIQLKNKSDQSTFLGRALSHSINTIITYSKYSHKICNLNLSLLKLFSTRLPLKWIDDNLIQSLIYSFTSLPSSDQFEASQLEPILELWSVWGRRIGELPETERLAYLPTGELIFDQVEHYLNSSHSKSKSSVELSLMVLVVISDVFLTKPFFDRSQSCIIDSLNFKDDSNKLLLIQSKFIHPTVSTILKHHNELSNPQKIIEDYLKLQNQGDLLFDENLNTIGTFLFIMNHLNKGQLSHKLVLNHLVNPVVKMIHDETTKNSLSETIGVSPLFALGGIIQGLFTLKEIPSKKYSSKIKPTVNPLIQFDFSSQDELTTNEQSIAFLLSQFKSIINLEKLSIDIKHSEVFLFNYLTKYWNRFTFNTNIDYDVQLAKINNSVTHPTFLELGKQSQLLGESMMWPFKLSNYFRPDKNDFIELIQTQLIQLHQFALNLSKSWEQGFLENPSQLIGDIKNPSNELIRKGLRSIIFSYVILFRSLLVRPMTATPVSDKELELMILSLYHLNFTVTIQVPRTIFTNHQNLLLALFDQVVTRQTQVQPLIETLLNDIDLNLSSSETKAPNEIIQSKISFLLETVEQLVVEMPNPLLELVIEKLIKPFAEVKYSWSQELYEASHSAALSIIQKSKAPCVPAFIEWYQNQMFDHFPGQMTGEQFKVAYTILVEGLSQQPETDADSVWKLFTTLHSKAEGCLSKLTDYPEQLIESIGYINTYAALLPHVPSEYLNQYLVMLGHLVRFFDDHPSITDNTVISLVGLIKRMITEGADLGVKPHLVGWYLSLLQTIKATKKPKNYEVNSPEFRLAA